jgi:hypothetical protein
MAEAVAVTDADGARNKPLDYLGQNCNAIFRRFYDDM